MITQDIDWEIEKGKTSPRLFFKGEPVKLKKIKNFNFLEKDFKSTIPEKDPAQFLHRRFLILLNVLKNSLSDSFNQDKSGTGMPNIRFGGWTSNQWLWFSRKGAFIEDPKDSLTFQVTVGKDIGKELTIDIWLTNEAQESKQYISKKIIENKESFKKLLGDLSQSYYIGIDEKGAEKQEKQISLIDDKFIEYIARELEKKKSRFFIRRYFTKKEAIQYGTEIPSEISNTFEKLIPISEFLGLRSSASSSPLLKFLKEEMKIQANYQPIVIKSLLEAEENHFTISLDEIKENIKSMNFDRDFDMNDAISAVSGALSKYVTFDDTVSLHLDTFSSSDITECLRICGQEIAKWHVNHIIENDIQLWRVKPGLEEEGWKYLDEFQQTSSIGVGWNYFGDLSEFETESDVNVHIDKTKPGFQSKSSITAVSHKMEEKDLVVVTKAQQEIVDFGIIISKYEFEDKGKNSYAHRRQVVWLNQGPILKTDFPEQHFGGSLQAAHEVHDVAKKRMLDFLLGNEKEPAYFILWRKVDSKWNDVSGRKYNFGKTVPNQKRLRNAGIGTKTIWFTKHNGDYYFWGHGTIKEIEVVKDDAEWNIVYDDFKYFKKQDDSLELEGQFLKHGSESIKEQIIRGKNFNNQHPITRITKKIYEEITGDIISVSSPKIPIETNNKFFNILNKKKQFFFYGPPGTGKTFTAKKIAREFIKESQTKFFTDEQYNEYVLSMINKVSHEKGFELKKQTDNQIILKNSQKEIRIYLNYSKSGKQTPHDCYVGISQSVIDFLNQTDDENRFVLILNNDVKNFVLIPHQFIIKNVKLSGGENWNSDGNGDHSFHIHVYDEKSQFRANDDYSENYVDCGDFLSNIEILFNSHGKSCNKLEKVTFHQSFSYEEFIEGIRPKTDDKINQVTYPIEDGIFKRLSKCASLHDKENFVLIIDEINRGNISKIFGELITLLENDKRGDEVTLPYSKKLFSVPENLYIIGTMNTADRSLVHIDAALKRRFGQYELMPDYSLLDSKIDKIHLGTLLENINQKIINAGFRDNQIGHSYFMTDKNPITTREELQFAFAYDIVPLLKDTFYDDDKILKDILGDEFIDANRDTISEWMEDVSEFMKALESAYPEAIE
jgi:DNA polymerase III delta prime subunit